jgi:hypothetical protein
MDVNVIREIVRRRPFESYRMRITDGREFVINHPEVVAVSPTGRSLIMILPDGTHVWLEPLLVSSIEMIPAPEILGQNGSSETH